MNNVDIGIDFGITNSDVVICSNNNFSYKSLRSEKNIHLSLNNIIKNFQEESKVYHHARSNNLILYFYQDKRLF